MDTQRPNNWRIGLYPWIIQDGNYPDFHIGERVAFALDFFDERPLAVVPNRTSRADAIGESSRHSVNAQVVHIAEGWWAIDCGGVRCFQESEPPRGIHLGATVTGEVYLGVDPFFYSASLCKEPDAPALTYEWLIREIVRETSPVIPHPRRLNVMMGDETRTQRERIAATNAWAEHRHEFTVHYLLTCELLDPTPHNPSRSEGGSTGAAE